MSNSAALPRETRTSTGAGSSEERYGQGRMRIVARSNYSGASPRIRWDLEARWRRRPNERRCDSKPRLKLGVGCRQTHRLYCRNWSRVGFSYDSGGVDSDAQRTVGSSLSTWLPQAFVHVNCLHEAKRDDQQREQKGCAPLHGWSTGLAYRLHNTKILKYYSAGWG